MEARLNIKNLYWKANDYYTRMNEDILKTVSSWLGDVPGISYTYDYSIIRVLTYNVVRYSLKINNNQFELYDGDEKLIKDCPYLNVLLDMMVFPNEENGKNQDTLIFNPEDKANANEDETTTPFIDTFAPMPKSKKVVNDEIQFMTTEDFDALLGEIHR